MEDLPRVPQQGTREGTKSNRREKIKKLWERKKERRMNAGKLKTGSAMEEVSLAGTVWDKHQREKKQSPRTKQQYLSSGRL